MAKIGRPIRIDAKECHLLDRPQGSRQAHCEARVRDHKEAWTLVPNCMVCRKARNSRLSSGARARDRTTLQYAISRGLDILVAHYGLSFLKKIG